jgi:hypothetical protein
VVLVLCWCRPWSCFGVVVHPAVVVEFAPSARVQGGSVYGSRSGVREFFYPCRKLWARQLWCIWKCQHTNICIRWKFKNINKWPLQGHWDPLMVLKRPLTNSEARLLTNIIYYFLQAKCTWIGKMIIDSQSEVHNPPVLQFLHYFHSVISAINYLSVYVSYRHVRVLYKCMFYIYH